MAQKNTTYNTSLKRSIEQPSTDRFVFSRVVFSLLLLPYLSFFSCGEPEIKLTRADRRTIDTLVNYQLDSISPILDSICLADKTTFIQRAADSIMLERKKREERLRLKSPTNK